VKIPHLEEAAEKMGCDLGTLLQSIADSHNTRCGHTESSDTVVVVQRERTVTSVGDLVPYCHSIPDHSKWSQRIWILTHVSLDMLTTVKTASPDLIISYIA